MRTPIKGLVTLALVLAFTPAGRAQTGGGAESNTHASRTSRHHVLPATPQNVQWGWYDPGEKPRLVVNSGDTISIETISHSLGQIKPARTWMKS